MSSPPGAVPRPLARAAEVAKGAVGCVFFTVGFLGLLAELVLAVWPAPGKYPWGLPGVLLGIAVVSAIRWRAMGYAMPVLLGMAAVPALAAWTLANMLGLD